MQLPENPFKHALAERRLQIGLWSQLPGAVPGEVLAGAGFDWIVIDTEHSPKELPDVLCQLQAMACSATAPVVRLAWNDMVQIKRVLDIGAQTILVPFVETEADARLAVAHTRYPPEGVRGVATCHRANRFGRVRDYHAAAAEEICVLVQIESRTALENLPAIAAVEGVDGIFIGPADLAASLGHLGRPDHPEVRAAIARAHETAQRAGKPTGILTAVDAEIRGYIDAGFTFVAVGSDLALLARQAEALAARYSKVPAGAA